MNIPHFFPKLSKTPIRLSCKISAQSVKNSPILPQAMPEIPPRYPRVSKGINYSTNTAILESLAQYCLAGKSYKHTYIYISYLYTCIRMITFPPSPPPSLFSTPDLYPLGDLTGKYKEKGKFQFTELPLYGQNTLIGKTIKTTKQVQH